MEGMCFAGGYESTEGLELMVILLLVIRRVFGEEFAAWCIFNLLRTLFLSKLPRVIRQS